MKSLTLSAIFADYHIPVNNYIIYPIKFFTLEPSAEIVYYFQEGEKVESMLRTITENHITKFTYLNRLFSRVTVMLF